MAYLVSQIQDKVRPELLRRLPEENIKYITDDEFEDICNRVQSDLNRLAQIHWERYQSTTTADETNYEMSRPIMKVVYFKYEDDDWKDQRYTWVDDVIVLKTAPGAGKTLDIRYLGDTLDVTESTDEIDLPDQIMNDFIALVRKLAMVQFGDFPQAEYDRELEYRAEKVKAMLPRRGTLPDFGVFSWWAGMSGSDDFVYDIAEKWVSNDSVVYDGSNYIFVE